MIKYILIVLSLLSTLLAKDAFITNNQQKTIERVGIKVSEISSVRHGYIKDSKKLSTVIFGKIIFEKSMDQYKISDMYGSDGKFKNSNKNQIAILIVTDDEVEILAEWICSSCSSSIKDFYHDPIKLISQKKLAKFIPKSIKSKEGIIIPTQSGIDEYMFWNGKKYELFTTDEMP